MNNISRNDYDDQKEDDPEKDVVVSTKKGSLLTQMKRISVKTKGGYECNLNWNAFIKTITLLLSFYFNEYICSLKCSFSFSSSLQEDKIKQEGNTRDPFSWDVLKRRLTTPTS